MHTEANKSGTDSVYVIGEMACSHDGDPELAKTIIDAVATSGAQAIQFQIWKWDTRVVPHHAAVDTMKRVEISPDTWTDLKNYVRGTYPDLDIIGCVGEPFAISVAKQLDVDGYKLHASDLSNEHIVKSVAETGKRIDLSVGGSSIQEIETALEWIKNTSSSEVWLMFGLQLFPTEPAHARLAYMMSLARLFDLPIGYQDHCEGGSDAGFWLPAAALGMGCRILEKHITHDRSLRGVDHEAALNPDEFAAFMQMVETVSAGIGNEAHRPFNEAELKYRKYAKKSLVLSDALEAGAVLSPANLTPRITPDTGYPPDLADELTGRTLKRSMKQFETIRAEDLE